MYLTYCDDELNLYMYFVEQTNIDIALSCSIAEINKFC